jgi:hypothetical protein
MFCNTNGENTVEAIHENSDGVNSDNKSSQSSCENKDQTHVLKPPYALDDQGEHQKWAEEQLDKHL